MLSSFNYHRFIPKIVMTKSTNPYINLAYEMKLLKYPETREKVLYLWRNSPVVVIGKHQNPFKECNLKYMKENNIILARRLTGGGAVYQDLGNTCWTFVEPTLRIEENTEIVKLSLEALQIDPQIISSSGRNDIEVNEMKVSGAAFRKEKKGSIHHGTMLLSTDFNVLSQALQVNKAKLEAKGVDSVRKRVTNLIDFVPGITHEDFCHALIKAYSYFHGACDLQWVDENDMLKDDFTQKTYQLLSSNDFIFGQFSDAKVTATKRWPWGLFDLTFDVKNGRLEHISVATDCLHTLLSDKYRAAVDNPEKAKVMLNTLTSEAEADLRPMAKELEEWTVGELEKYL